MARYALAHGRVQSEDSTYDAVATEKLVAAEKKRRNRERDPERGDRGESRHRRESRHRGGDLGNRPRSKRRRRSTAAAGDLEGEERRRRRSRSRSRSAPPPPPPKRCGRYFCRDSYFNYL